MSATNNPKLEGPKNQPKNNETEKEELRRGFKKIESVDEVKSLLNRFIQIYLPRNDIYHIGNIVRIKERVRERDGKKFVRVYLGEGHAITYKRPFDMSLYRRLENSGKLDSGTIIQHFLARKPEYKIMEPE